MPRTRLQLVHAPDVVALAILAGFCVLLPLYHRTAIIEDFWYHLALGHWIAENGRLFLHDPVSFQPFGRPQLYPLLIHSVVAVAERVAELFRGNVLTGALLVKMGLYVGNLAAVWWTGRKLLTPLAGLLALVLAATDQALFYSAWSLMPASMIGLLMVLLVLALERQRHLRAGLLLAAAFYTHLAFPYLVALGLALAAWTRPAMRRGLLTTLAIGVGAGLPFLAFVLWNSSAFYVDKAVNYNPIPGLGPFGYASHYHMDVVLLLFAALGFFRLVLPRSRGAAAVFTALAVLTTVLIGMKGLSTWSAQWIHPMTLLNVGSAFAIAAFLGALLLGIRVLLPARGPRVDRVLALTASALAVAVSALIFNVEMAGRWDGLVLAAFFALSFIACSALVGVAMRRMPPILRALTAAGVGLMFSVFLVQLLNAVVEPAQRMRMSAQTWGTAAFFLLCFAALAAMIAGMLRALPLPRTYRLPAGLHIAVCFLLGLLPTVPLYGGRYFWHVVPVMALVAVGDLRMPKAPKPRRLPRPVYALALAYLALLLVIKWPLFAYSRGFRQELKPYAGPVLMATTARAPAEYEEQDFRDLVAWVKTNVPADAVIHTDDPRTAHMLYVFTERVADNGMFWEAQTKRLQDDVAKARALNEGAYVYTGTLPVGVNEDRTFGKWKVSIMAKLPTNGVR